MKNLLILLCLLVPLVLMSQDGKQNVKGIIIDQESELPLIGATINMPNDPNVGAVTDIDGLFTIPGVPVGRQSFVVSYIGYESTTIPNVEVTAGKEVYLNLSIQESFNDLDEVVVIGTVAKDEAINEMATISTRQFSMEEVNRFSGGRSDVGRLAGNFAGVATADDSRNDIVIRGNSPTGLLWRLEGIPIPSPNHFSTVGTTGGPVSALNTNLLKSSDFITSAYPAEYGNALSGVFDLGFRSGNKDKIETTLQVGAVTGLEALVEGPISKKNNSSFLIAYRYSFLGVATSLGLEIGTNAVPRYDDLSFKFDFGKSTMGNFTLFGIWGTSDIEFLHDEVDEADLFAADDEDAFADSRFGVVGLKHNLILDESSYLRTVVAYSGSANQFSRFRFYNQDTAEEIRELFVEGDNKLRNMSLSSYYNRKFSPRLTGRTGILVEQTNMDVGFSSAEFGLDTDQDGIFDLIDLYSSDDSALRLESFAQAKYKLTEKLTAIAGVHGLYYDLTEKFVLEPRLALNYQVNEKHKVNFGYGLHHQTLPLPLQLAIYFENEQASNPNLELDFTRSNQFVLGHDFKIADSWRSKLEVYYQGLSDVPVDRVSSSFSVLNVGADFGFPIDHNNLVNEGTGVNRGIELTIEKFFTNSYYILLTGSLFDSKYVGSDGIERNTAFNNQYVLNVLAGKEFSWGKQKQHRFTLDTKLTTAGGRFFTPVDLQASRINEIEVRDESRAFSEQFDPYFRWDIKMGVKLNSVKRKFSQSFYFDVQNVTAQENVFNRAYNRATNEVNETLQLGFFPNFIYKIEF